MSAPPPPPPPRPPLDAAAGQVANPRTRNRHLGAVLGFAVVVVLGSVVLTVTTVRWGLANFST